MSLVAFPLLVLAVTGVPVKAGLVGFAQTVPMLLVYLPAGVPLDRHDRRAAVVREDDILLLSDRYYGPDDQEGEEQPQTASAAAATESHARPGGGAQ